MEQRIDSLSTLNYNPYLREGAPRREQRVGNGVIDVPGRVENIVWQTRTRPPTEYENRLGDALEQVFEAGAVALEDVVAKLNDMGVRTEDGRRWTAEVFGLEIERFAAR